MLLKMETKLEYFEEFLEILEPSEKITSGNKLQKYYIAYCNNYLNVYSDEWLFVNRQEFINTLRQYLGVYEIFNEKTKRSKGWKMKIKNKYDDLDMTINF